MLCEHYKDALTEAAASSRDLTGVEDLDPGLGALRAHLSGCASCRAAYADEQSLFAAIESGLHSAANAEVPPSLLTRVRVRLDESAIARPRWSSSWVALVGAAVAAVAFFLVLTADHNNPRTALTNLAANETPVPRIVPSTQGAPASAVPKKGDSILRLPVSIAKNSGQAEELASPKSTPEILVPRDQEILLASYARQWDSRKHAPLVAGEVDQTGVAVLEISPIQIAGLDVKPLAEGDSQ